MKYYLRLVAAPGGPAVAEGRPDELPLVGDMMQVGEYLFAVKSRIWMPTDPTEQGRACVDVVVERVPPQPTATEARLAIARQAWAAHREALYRSTPIPPTVDQQRAAAKSVADIFGINVEDIYP